MDFSWTSFVKQVLKIKKEFWRTKYHKPKAEIYLHNPFISSPRISLEFESCWFSYSIRISWRPTHSCNCSSSISYRLKLLLPLRSFPKLLQIHIFSYIFKKCLIDSKHKQILNSDLELNLSDLENRISMLCRTIDFLFCKIKKLHVDF